MYFRPLNLSDIKYFKEKPFPYTNYYGSELCFTNLYAWKEIDKIEIYTSNHFVLLKGIYNGDICFLPPILFDHTTMAEVLSLLEKYCDTEKIPLVLNGFNQCLKETLQSQINFPHHIIEQPDLFEYLYEPSHFFNYPGKRLHAKRNHLNKFIKSYSYSFRSYDPNDYANLINLLDLWTNGNGLPTLEIQAIQSVLLHLQELDAFCDLIEMDATIVAFSIGTISHNNTGIILFEKADVNYDGIYAALNSFVASKRYYNCTYINRQEDMGIPELRKSKQSYRPIAFEQKYTIYKDDEYYQTKKEIRALYESSFDDSPYYMNYFFSEKYHYNRLWTKKVDNQVVSSLHIVEKTLSFHKLLIRYPYIVAASTKTEYRKQGHMRDLIKQVCNDLFKQGEWIVGLNPIDKSFYQQFGFAFCTYAKPFVITGQSDANDIKLTRIDMTQFSMLKQIYEQFSTRFDSFIVRDETYWKNFIREVVFDNGYFELLYDDKNLIGYLVFVNNQIDELCLLDSSILTSLTKYNNQTVFLPTQDVHYPYNMIRIIDARKLIETYPYDTILTGSISFELTDSLIQENNIKVKLTVDKGICYIEDTSQVDYVLSIDQLAQLLFSPVSLESFLPFRLFFKPSINLIYDKF
ncbi:MAG TPA: GNAT family N-acetyltransferase [Bacilli bacterium]|nr:GNAT family N-acetyltransferase [Bacilli bacterium]